MPKNEMDIQILPDGRLRVETNDWSGPAHVAADKFLKLVGELMGGEVTTEKVKHSHVHNHSHVHSHEQDKQKI